MLLLVLLIKMTMMLLLLLLVRVMMVMEMVVMMIGVALNTKSSTRKESSKPVLGPGPLIALLPAPPVGGPQLGAAGGGGPSRRG